MSLCCHSNNKQDCVSSKHKKYTKKILIGPPNVGKSSYFNKITWQNNNVGNIDKITVSPKIGSFKGDKETKIVDLPGSYCLAPNTIDESFVIKTIMNNDFDKIIGIISANNFERDMFLILETLESQKLDHLLINMIDELKDFEINPFKLSRKLGVDVQLISCLKNKNIKTSINSIQNFENKHIKEFKIDYGPQLELVISKVEEIIPDDVKVNKRFLAIQLLSDNKYVKEQLDNIDIYSQLASTLCSECVCAQDIKWLIKKTKREYIKSLFDFACTVINEENSLMMKTNKIDKIIFNKWIGIPLFLLVILAIYFVTFFKYAGGFLTESINLGFEKLSEIINNAMVNGIVNPNSQWIADFVTDGLLGSIFTVIGFLPNIAIIFFFTSILEQTGYLARVSVMLDKTLERFGISGRSIVTLLTGVGCNIPSVIMSRNAQSHKERIIVVLIAPLVVCGARIVVFNWISEILVGSNISWFITFLMTIFSIFVALCLGLCFSKTLFRNQKTFFLTELPPWRKPQFGLVFKSLGLEIWDFIKRVFTIVFILGLITFFLSRISPTTGLINEAKTGSQIDLNNASFLEYISYGFKYIFYPIGLGEDWRISYSLISAFPAKELASSNLELLFTGSDPNLTFADNFRNAVNAFNLPVASVTSYFMFFAFYTPCFSLLGVIRKEVGWKWMFVQFLTSILFAYVFSFYIYNLVGIFEKNIINHPYNSNGVNIFVIVSCLVCLLTILCWYIYEWTTTTSKQINLSLKQHKVKKIILWSTFGYFTLCCLLNIFFLYLG